jgi:hypothetical protein
MSFLIFRIGREENSVLGKERERERKRGLADLINGSEKARIYVLNGK